MLSAKLTFIVGQVLLYGGTRSDNNSRSCGFHFSLRLKVSREASEGAGRPPSFLETDLGIRKALSAVRKAAAMKRVGTDATNKQPRI